MCGVPIEGEPGHGYRLPKTFEIPPLMFERHELEALVVGARFVEAWCGPGLAASARSALVRIRGVVPSHLIGHVDDARIYALRFGRDAASDHFDVLHEAIGGRRRIVMDYAGEDGRATEDRSVRPLGLYFWGKVWTLAAWCELRDDFRSFRVDRIRAPRLGDTFPDEPAKALEAYLARVQATP